MPIAELSAALSSIKAVTDIAKGIIGLNKDVAVNQKAAELLGVITALQSQLSAHQSEYDELLQSKRDLEKQLEEFQRWSETESHYELKEVHTAIFVYAPKEKEKSEQPVHWLCTNCWEERKKSILQCNYKHSGGASYTCPRCNLTIKMTFDDHINPIVETGHDIFGSNRGTW